MRFYNAITAIHSARCPPNDTGDTCKFSFFIQSFFNPKVSEKKEPLTSNMKTEFDESSNQTGGSRVEKCCPWMLFEKKMVSFSEEMPVVSELG